MKRLPSRMLLVLLVSGCLAMAACSTSTGGTSTGGGSTPSPTATAAPTKPTSVPTITLALCEQMLSISQANQILSPANPVNNIVADNGGVGGSCNYEYAQFKIDLILYFEAYHGGQLSQLAQMAVNAAANGQLHNTTITANQQVTGIGDQAWFLAGTSTGSGLSGHADILYVVDGSVAFGVENLTFNGIGSLGSASDTTLESEFEQIAPMVINGL